MIEHRVEIPKVKKVFPMTNSIFTKMNYDLIMDNGMLDLLFYTDFGLKSIAPLVSTILGDDETLSSEKLVLLATMLKAKYQNKWDRLKEVYQAEYDPLHNFLDEYSESGSNTRDDITTASKGETFHEDIITDNTYTRTDNLTEGNSGSSTSRDTGGNDASRYGFNSSDGVGTESVDTDISNTSSNSNTRTNTGTQTNREVRNEDRDFVDSHSDRVQLDGEGSYSKSGVHSGNIGNITTQKLIGEEIELWKWNFVDEVLHDARDFLTIAVYDL